MSRSLRPFLLLTALLLVRFSHGQYANLTFRSYASPEGLPLSEVTRAFQATSGFLWVGTTYGLARFDGKQFKNFYHHLDSASSLGSDYIADISEDRNGLIWIAYQNLFGSLNPLSLKAVNHDIDGLRMGSLPLQLFCLEVDAADRIWMGTSEGLAMYDPSTDSLMRVPGQTWNGPGSAVRTLAIDSDGQLMVGTEGQGIWYARMREPSMIKLVGGEETGAVNDITLAGPDQAWLACGHGLFKASWHRAVPGGINIHRAEFLLSHDEMRSVVVDRKGNIWIATPASGLYIYFPKTAYLDVLKENFISTRGLLSNRIWSLSLDNWGGVWVASESGLQSFHNDAQKFNIYPGISKVTNELRGSFIYGIYEVDNDLLIATSGSVLAYNRITNRFIPIRIKHEMANKPVRFRTIQYEGGGRWWVSSDNGFFELERKGQEFELHRLPLQKYFPQLGSWSFRNYLKGKNGDYWFSTDGKGLVHCQPASRKWETYVHDRSRPTSLQNDLVMVIAYDREGKILIGHEEGMSIFDPATQEFVNIKERGPHVSNGLTDRSAFDIWDDGEHYWVGTYGGGLNMVDKRTRKVSYFLNPEGKGSNAINMLMPDRDSVLWMGTNNGLVRFSTKARTFQNFGIAEGMPASEFNMYSRFKNDEGEIFMGTIEGMFSFHPDSIGPASLKPHVLLSRLRMDGKVLLDSVVAQVNRDQKFSLDYGKDLFMEFSPMTFFGNSNYILRYRFLHDGQDTTWKEGEAGFLIPLIKIEPGEYTLKVRMDEGSTMKSSDEWKMRLVVVPPFWMTWPFRIFLITLGLIILYAIIRGYISRRLERQRQEFERQQLIEKERSRISAELHDDIGGGLTAIRLMSEMARESDRDPSLKTIHGKISNAANDIVQKMNEIVWALNVNHDDLPSLVAYTRQFAMSYLDDMGLKSTFQVPDRIPAMRVSGVNRRNIFLLVKESLNNVVKHAGASEVEVDFTLDRNLRIRVKDNGKGLPATPNQGNGLTNMRRRVDSMEGSMDIVSDHGTTIIFTIPLDRLGA